MKVQWKVLLCIALLAAIVAGCAPLPAQPAAAPAPATQAPAQQPAAAAPAATQAPAAQAGTKPLRVALILPGRADDVSWNQAAYDGMQRAVKEAKVPVELKVVEQVYDPVAIEPALRDYAQQGYDLIVGHGFQFQEPVIKVAADFPKVNFAIGTGFKLAPNVGVYDVKLEQGGYLMGILAGMLTKANITGVVGGVDVSEIHRGHVAFGQGAKSVNKNIKVLNNFVGDFNNLSGAKESALSLMKAGADVLWQSGDGVGIAVLGACKEQNKLCMGNVANQTKLAPDNTVASFVYDWGPVFTNMINQVADAKYGNQKYWIEFANKGVSINYNDALKSKITPEIQAAMDKAQKGFETNTLDLGDLDSVKIEQ